jgi:AAA lid domain
VEGEQQALRDKLTAATERLPEVAISRDTKLKISEVLIQSHPAAEAPPLGKEAWTSVWARTQRCCWRMLAKDACAGRLEYQVPPCVPQICSLLEVDGIRGDMVVNRAAKALVALEGRTEVTLEDVARVIALCLNHRCAVRVTVSMPGYVLYARSAHVPHGPGVYWRGALSGVLTIKKAVHRPSCFQQSICCCRMRKDPLDPIDNGTKVALAFRRVTNPKVCQRAPLDIHQTQTTVSYQHIPLQTATWAY